MEYVDASNIEMHLSRRWKAEFGTNLSYDFPQTTLQMGRSKFGISGLFSFKSKENHAQKYSSMSR